ncbi:hypothetical protein G9A89_019488 [Geosiphon pyriformis]|nr:hypothetical protein G9A89_019488 [Geosiphon pyriformis]
MAMEEANRTKFVNLAIGETSSTLKTISPINNNSNPKDINHPKDKIKITLHHFPITSLRIAITVEFLATGKEIAESYNETNKIGVINVTLHHTRLTANPTAIPTTTHTILLSTCSKTDYTKSIYTTKPIPNPTTTTLNPDFYHTAPSEGRAAAQQQNLFYTLTTIPPARITENANLSDIFPFEFEANESPFLLSNAAANEQKTIMAIYTEAEVEGKTIHLILNSGSAGSIITYQLMQQLKRNVD